MRCFDDSCSQPATKELLGYPMCVDHYIEALEHGAHLVWTNAPLPEGFQAREIGRDNWLAHRRIQGCECRAWRRDAKCEQWKRKLAMKPMEAQSVQS